MHPSLYVCDSRDHRDADYFHSPGCCSLTKRPAEVSFRHLKPAFKLGEDFFSDEISLKFSARSRKGELVTPTLRNFDGFRFSIEILLLICL